MKLNEALFEDIRDQIDPEKIDNLEYNIPDYDSILDRILESWDSRYEFDSNKVINSTQDHPSEYPELIHPTEDQIRMEFEEQAVSEFCRENSIEEITLQDQDKFIISQDAVLNTVLPDYDDLYERFAEFEEWWV